MHADSMRINMDQVVDASREVPKEDVAALVERIYRIKYSDIVPTIELAWHEEIHRRIADLESGRVQGIPIEETLASMRAIVLVGDFAGG